jgi:parvulin-like peptidyl-prolyl isomerase
MIQSMRKNAAVIMWIVIVAFVATIVFAWGMDLSSRNRVKDTVGKVNGKDISLKYFEKAVSSEREKQREQYQGQEVPAAQNRMIPRQVWENEVSRILLRDVFSKMQIGASSDEIFEYIKRNPPPEVFQAKQFQTDSVFDTTKFIAFLNNPAVYENEGMLSLEKYTKDFLVPMQTLRFLVSLQNFPTSSEIGYEYRQQKEKAVFEYAGLTSQKFHADAITDDMISSYYQAHEDSFATEEQSDLYFVKIPKTATAGDEKATYQEMLTLRTKINNSDSNFAEEARLESDDEASGAQGGGLGWVSKGQMVPEFEAVAFTAAPHVVSMPVKTRFGYHLILVEERQTKDGKEQVKARHILRKVVPSGETIDRLNAMADSLHAKIVAEGVKSVTPRDTMVIVDSTGLFKRGDVMPKVGYVSGAGVFAFQRAENETSDLLENDDGYYIFQVKQKVKNGILPLAIARQRIAGILSETSRLAKARAYVDAFIKKVSSADAKNVANYSKVDSLFVSGTTDTVAHNQFIPGVGFNNKAVAAAFALPDNATSPVIEVNGTFYIVKPLWHKKITEIPWTSPEVMTIRRKMMSEAGQQNFTDWYLDVKSKAKIVDNVNQFYIE